MALAKLSKRLEMALNKTQKISPKCKGYNYQHFGNLTRFTIYVNFLNCFGDNHHNTPYDFAKHLK